MKTQSFKKGDEVVCKFPKFWIFPSYHFYLKIESIVTLVDDDYLWLKLIRVVGWRDWYDTPVVYGEISRVPKTWCKKRKHKR